MSIVNILKRVQLLATLSDDELAQIAALCTEKSVSAGEMLIEQNTTGKEMYIVGEGAAEVFIKGLSDNRSLVVLGKGQVIGEMALIDQGYRSASVRATQDGATLYVIQSDDFNQLCRTNTHIGHIAMRNMAIDLAFKLRHRNLTEL